MSVDFFSQLFQGHHRSNGGISDSPFSPNFDLLDVFLENVGQLGEIEAESLTGAIILEEVLEVIEEAPSNKSPGMDGLTYELYKHRKEVLAPVLVEIFNSWHSM